MFYTNVVGQQELGTSVLDVLGVWPEDAVVARAAQDGVLKRRALEGDERLGSTQVTCQVGHYLYEIEELNYSINVLHYS